MRYTLTTEGTSDRLLVRHIEWLLERHSGVEFDGQWANPESFEHHDRDVGSRMREAMRFYPCDLLFVHRDADNAGVDARSREIKDAVAACGIDFPVVCVVPVRMTEAWLLADESAIRQAAGNTKGRVPLSMPQVAGIERIADPKALLDEILVLASSATGRKRDQFKRKLSDAKQRVAGLVEDFDILRRLPAFLEFERNLVCILQENGWGKLE